MQGKLFTHPGCVRAGVAAVVLAVLWTAPTAQLGSVLGVQKVSDTAGGFTAPLRDDDQFGRSINPLGDLDGNGVTDLLVGAHGDDDGGADKGAVYVLFMHPSGNVSSWAKISDLSGGFGGHLDPGDQFGRAAAGIGDLDLDGVPDVVVSSNYDDDGGTNKGAVYVLFLRPDGSVKASQKISSSAGELPAQLAIHDEFGRSIACPGDLDSDGIPDIVVGTPEDDDGGTNTGALHVLFLNRDGTVKDYRRISRSTDALRLKPGDWFGHSLASLGDFDHDGVPDLLVGSVLDDDGGVNQGSVWILFLNPDGSVKESHEINETTGGLTAVLDDFDHFGASVACLGDLDGDGVTDIAVGAVKDDDGGAVGDPNADVGAVYVLFLNPDATVKSWSKLSATSGNVSAELDQNDWFGCALCPLGSAPGDGLFNLAIGCRYDDDGGSNHGAIYLTQLDDGNTPVPDFDAAIVAGLAPLSVSFEDHSSGQVTAWLWSFGDGARSSLQNPTRVYATPGTYDVTLSVKGPSGRDSTTKTAFVTVRPNPRAEFQASPAVGLAPLEVAFTDLSEGTITAWAWDFGDGSGSSLGSPTHVFGPGTFPVSLTVSGPGGADTWQTEIQVADSAPTADFSASSVSGRAPLEVSFTDLSAGVVTAWAWDFGDGTGSTLSDPSHVYSLPGDYSVVLRVTGPGGQDDDQEIGLISVLPPPPDAAFEPSLTSGPAPLTVGFADLSSGTVSTWSWSFGDGNTSGEANPTHTYEVPGDYTVTLTVQGPDGSDFETRSQLIHALWPPPVAEFAAGPVTGFAPHTVAFTDLSSGMVTSWVWSFGDGTRARSRWPVKLYRYPGDYSVTLTVQGPGGVSEVTHPGISVQALPVLADGGFESDTPDLAPTTPWSVLAGTAIRVGSSAEPEADFPSEGTHWCEIGSEGGTPLEPAGIGCSFAFDPLAPHLVFDASFVPGDPDPLTDPASVFMSVEIDDGSTTREVFRVDGSAELPSLSLLHGLGMTARERVHVDLTELFPGLSPGAPLELRVRVDNAGDATRPAWGHVDGFGLVPAASASFRNGTGHNAVRYESTSAVLGGTWTIRVDTTGHTGARTIQLVGAQRPTSGAMLASGEVLITGTKLFTQSWPALPGINEHAIELPLDLSLIGTSMATQVTITGGGSELCNAWDLVLGF